MDDEKQTTCKIHNAPLCEECGVCSENEIPHLATCSRATKKQAKQYQRPKRGRK